MGFCGGRTEKNESPAAEQKWDYINLDDFKSTSCLTPMSYGILYISLVISLACYAVDLFTAVNLLVFDRWSGQVKPVVPFSITRWIFAGCIILSWILLAVRWFRAIRAINSGGVAQSYLDPLAVRVQSVRMGARGQGYRRFLVFAELTKSKKGSEYLALFTYFSFEAWLRIVFAEGPRNAINAMTLYSVMRLNLVPTGQHVGDHTPAIQFFYNVQALTNENKEQAAIYFGMLFTLVIWLFAALGFIAACTFYVVFLWHHIPSQDGGLSGFCKRKIDSRLQKIVTKKVNKVLKRQNEMLSKASTSNIGPGELKRQPTVPNLDLSADDKLPEMPLLPRTNTTTTLPPYSSRPPTRNEDPMPGLNRQPTIPDVSPISPLSSRPTFPSRSATQVSAMSNRSFTSHAPLLSDAQEPGHGPPGRAYTPNDRPPVNRSFTNGSQTSNRSRPQYRNGPPPDYTSRNPSYNSQNGPGPGPRGPPSRQNTNASDDFNPGPLSRQGTDQIFFSTRSGPPQPYTTYDSQDRQTPGMGPRLPYQPQRQNTSMSANSAPAPYPPQRQNTNLSSASEPTFFPPRPQRQATNATLASTIPRSTSAPRFQAYTPTQTASPVDVSPPPLPTSTPIPPSLTPAPHLFSPHERAYSPSQARNFSAPTRLGSPQVTPTFPPPNAPFPHGGSATNGSRDDFSAAPPAKPSNQHSHAKARNPPNPHGSVPAHFGSIGISNGPVDGPSRMRHGQPGVPRQVEQQRPRVVQRSGSVPLMEAQSARIESGGSYDESIFDAYGGSGGMSGGGRERPGMGTRNFTTQGAYQRY